MTCGPHWSPLCADDGGYQVSRGGKGKGKGDEPGEAPLGARWERGREQRNRAVHGVWESGPSMGRGTGCCLACSSDCQPTFPTCVTRKAALGPESAGAHPSRCWLAHFL